MMTAYGDSVFHILIHCQCQIQPDKEIIILAEQHVGSYGIWW